MKSPISLDGTSFDFREVCSKVPQRTFLTWENGKEKLQKLSDFGTIFIGQDSFLNCSWLAEEAPESPIFVSPDSWRMPQIVKALGAFESTSQARKNGWDKDIPFGIGFHMMRINKIRGMVITMKLEK